MTTPRLRFAPSPSGYLHIGGARTALFCWLLARKHGGTFILRIEDTDADRSTDASIQAILDSLRWLGLQWDEGPIVGGPHPPYFQSQRKAVYQRHVEALLQKGHLYRCYCTEEELATKREAQIAAGKKPEYDRTCRYLDPATWTDDRPYVLRLRAPLDGETVVDDLVKGRVVFQNKELSDQVVVRSNGDPLYNFVVVVDDVEMGMTHVVRGDDHLNNTPKQIQLYQAMGATLPRFAHVPLILGPDKKRLSKRHGATAVGDFDKQGYLADAMINYLARLGWSHGDQEVFTRDELVQAFSVENCGRSAGVWNPEKLLWINAEHMKRMPVRALSLAVAPRVGLRGWVVPAVDEQMDLRITTLRERARTLEELVDFGSFYWADARLEYGDEKARTKFLVPENADRLDALATAFDACPRWEQGALQARVESLLAEWGLAIGKVAQPLRVAITGSTVSPGIFETLAALGREKSIARIRRAARIARGEEH
jgi:glutamyl-tRNA synthetase